MSTTRSSSTPPDTPDVDHPRRFGGAWAQMWTRSRPPAASGPQTVRPDGPGPSPRPRSAAVGGRRVGAGDDLRAQPPGVSSCESTDQSNARPSTLAVSWVRRWTPDRAARPSGPASAPSPEGILLTGGPSFPIQCCSAPSAISAACRGDRDGLAVGEHLDRPWLVEVSGLSTGHHRRRRRRIRQPPRPTSRSRTDGGDIHACDPAEALGRACPGSPVVPATGARRLNRPPGCACPEPCRSSAPPHRCDAAQARNPVVVCCHGSSATGCAVRRRAR